MLDHEIIEKFKEFQRKTGKYQDLDIEAIQFKKVFLSTFTIFTQKTSVCADVV